jgi:hypothetical protein
MNIRDWPMDRVMQLPDHCFGRRWPIDVSSRVYGSAVTYDISEESLPERCVIWNLYIYGAALAASRVCVFLRLGDFLPTVAAEIGAMERLFRMGYMSVGQRHVLRISGLGPAINVPMRMPIAAGGMRLVASFTHHDSVETEAHAIITVSAMPNEVSDCYA